MEKEYRFIERTQRIIKQYNRFHLPDKEFFDVTLLLNCCVGLLLAVKQKDQHSFLKKNKTPLSEWGINEKAITLIKNRNLAIEEKSLFNVCKHLRNSIAHCHFSAYASKQGKTIDRIVFDDFIGEQEIPEKQSFHYKTTVKEFRGFLEKLSGEATKHIRF